MKNSLQSTVNSLQKILHPLFTVNCKLSTVNRSRGFTLVEALVASAVALFVILGVTSAFTLALRASFGNVTRIQVAFLAEEGMEAVRVLRDDGWNANIAALTVGTPYYLTFDGTTWRSSATPVYTDGKFLRSFTLNSVNRDGSTRDIVDSGGTLDSDTKRLTVTVAWSERGATTTRSLQTYLTNVFSN